MDSDSARLREPDLILENARAITMDPAVPRAGSIAIRGRCIAAVAPDARLAQLAGPGTRIVDCGGGTVLPGLIDAHCHVHALAESLVTLDVGPRRVRSIADLQAALRHAAAGQPPSTWLRAHGYDELALRERRHPTREDLDAAAPLHPVKLSHRSGHAVVLNTLALARVGISIETADPEGALIDRHPDTGEPTGVLFDMAAFLAGRIPRLDDAQLEAGMRLASRRLLSLGITSVQDASPRNGRSRWRRFQRWKETGILGPRVSMMLGCDEILASSPGELASPVDPAHLCLAGVKVMVGETSGRLHPTPDDLDEIVMAIHRAGRQAVLHAIEEPAIEAACRAIGRAVEREPRPDHRHRIEHCSICPPALRQRLAALGILVVTQPSFVYHGGDRYLATVPRDRLEHLYPIAALLEDGIAVAAGSDAPVVPPDPFQAISAAVSRRTAGGAVLGPEHGVPLEAALRMYTASAARAAFEESWKGTITPGKRADLVVLDRDITRVPPDELAGVGVRLTILDGRIAWEA